MTDPHTLYETNPLDIPAMLRALAADVESGEVPAESCVVVARCDEEVEVFCFGRIDSVRAFMDLHAGARELLR